MPLTDTDRNEMLSRLKKAMSKVCPPMVEKSTSDQGMEIIGNKPVPYGYKKEIIPGMYFASAVARKDMVSFYFFPCYTNAKAFSAIAPTLTKCLKGKTCFKFKKVEQVDEKELVALMKAGVKAWKEMGYMK
jgi:hypothetical protein